MKVTEKKKYELPIIEAEEIRTDDILLTSANGGDQNAEDLGDYSNWSFNRDK